MRLAAVRIAQCIDFQNGPAEQAKRVQHAYARGDDLDIGLRLSEEGELQEVVFGSPAFEAGLAPGSKVVAIGDAPWSAAELERQIAEAVASGRELTLFVERQKRLAPFEVEPKRGAVYPHLVAIAGVPDRLEEILRPLVPAR